jgi:hypothetical protein
LNQFRLPSEIPDEEWPPPSAFIDEAHACVAAAREEGINLRVMGGLAIYMHSVEYESLWEKLGRLGKKVFTDIDYVSYGKHRVKLLDFFKGRGFFINQKMLYLYGKTRQIYYGEKIPMAEIFFDRLEMNHMIYYKHRLEADYPTVPLSELLLQKLQMVRMNEKDDKDTIILLRAHEIGDDDDDKINKKSLESHLLTDWGFHFTAVYNLKRIKETLRRFTVLSEEDIKVIDDRLNQLIDYLENSQKSFKWKARSLIGNRIKRYNEVDEWDTIDSPPEESEA